MVRQLPPQPAHPPDLPLDRSWYGAGVWLGPHVGKSALQPPSPPGKRQPWRPVRRGPEIAPVVSCVDIARPPEEFFPDVTDPSRFAEWQEGALSGHTEGGAPPQRGYAVRHTPPHPQHRPGNHLADHRYQPATTLRLRDQIG